MQKIGSWAFLIGVLLAIVLGAMGAMSQMIGVILIVLGLIVGFLNITGKEAHSYLIAGVSLVIVTSLSAGMLASIEGLIMERLVMILNAINLMFVPATILVAIKSVFSMARDK